MQWKKLLLFQQIRLYHGFYYGAEYEQVNTMPINCAQRKYDERNF